MTDHPTSRVTAATPALPLDLPRLLMRRAGAVAAAVLLLALAAGLVRMAYDIGDEVDAAVTLATLVAGLGSTAPDDDATILAALRQRAADHPPRHLLLRVHDDAGQVLLAPPALPPAGPVLGPLLAAHRALLSVPDARQVRWQITRPSGARWTVTLAASHESERRESLINLLGTLALLLVCITGLLLAMRFNLRRALSPLGQLLAAIGGIEGQHGASVRQLPTMPVRELEAIAAALRQLGQALDEAQGRRRLLSQQVLSLQEDERARLARELHDEFGQRLTALRVDAAWLARRLVAQPAAAEVVAGMAVQCQLIQQDIRGLLLRLQPFGPVSIRGHGARKGPNEGAADGLGDVSADVSADGPNEPSADAAADVAADLATVTAADIAAATGQPLARLVALLQALVAGWAALGGAAPSAPSTGYRLLLLAENQAGQPQPWPGLALAEDLWLPQALALALYRISQEALTNVARHAQARQATLQLVCRGALQPGGAVSIAWSVADDGIGLPGADAQAAATAAGLRGSGLPGLRERVWAQGAELGLASSPGLCLSACFDTRWLVLPSAAAAP